MKRIQISFIIKDLDKKMVFLVGPRQVGKTWLAKEIAKTYKKILYLNYDNFHDRKIINNQEWDLDLDLIIFDELHKLAEWKNYLKGVYDKRPSGMRILVTGSARLDTFCQAGDSLVGRFFKHRLLPFSLSEIHKSGKKIGLNDLILKGGFPEALLSENEINVKRWRNLYIDGLIRTDILDFEKIHDFKAVQHLLELLRSRVGSPVSYSSLAVDLNISPNTVKKYIHIFESLYIVFRVSPYTNKIARSILKEPKIYFYDIGMVRGDDGIKFENLVALSLLKHLYGLNDYHGERYVLHYVRTKEGKEVDFCLANDNEIENFIEVKNSEHNISRTLRYFCDKYNQSGIQIVKNLTTPYVNKGIKVVQGESFLEKLFL